MRTTRSIMLAGAAVLAMLGSTARAAPPELIVEAELDRERVYVGAEALLRLRLLRAPGVPHGTLRAPALGETAQVALVGRVRTYETERDGVTYQVLERLHVIVPRRAGRIVVPGAEFESMLRYADIFHRDPRLATAPTTARGPQLELEALPPPPDASEPWLPARRVTLEEAWSRDPAALSDGTPVTRTLIITAEGLAAERLPGIEMAEHPALMLHHDRPGLATDYLAAGMTGRRVQRVVLMPVAVGEVALPELSVRWWDVAADTPRTATLPGRTLSLQTPIAPVAKVRVTEGISMTSALRWSLAGIVVLWALGLWRYERTRARREAIRRLRAACRKNDPIAARDALLDWGKAVGRQAILARRLVPSPDGAARPQLASLDRALYAGGAWDGREFWRRVRPLLRKLARPVEGRPDPRDRGLFRLQADQAKSGRFD